MYQHLEQITLEFVINRLLELTRKDEEKLKLAEIKNKLESFSYDVKNKLYEEEYELCSTEEEREEIREKLNAIIDWYDEAPFDTPLKVNSLSLNMYFIIL